MENRSRLPNPAAEKRQEKREEKLGGAAHTLDFSEGLDYELDDASYGLGSYKTVDVVGTDKDKYTGNGPDE